MPAIPASQIVSVIPSVLDAGGTALDLNGLMLTQSNRVPVGTVQSFPDVDSVSQMFGATSLEAGLASIYFLGFLGSTARPGALLMSQYPTGPVGAWLRGGNLASMTLTQLQALNGSLNVTVDGTPHLAPSINLSAATSFSSAAGIISTALAIPDTPGAVFTGSISTTVLTVTAVSFGTIVIGQKLAGGTTTAGTVITGFLTGSGGTGTYSVNNSQTVASALLTGTTLAVTFDSQLSAFMIRSSTTGTSSSMGFATGTLAAPLALSQATGAIASQGAAAATPASAMTAITAQTQNWASFMTMWEPSDADKVSFSAWNNSQNNRYLYAMWTNNVAATVTPDTTTAGYTIQLASHSGTALIYEPDTRGDKAAFVLGYVASLDFGALNGRATAMFRHQDGLVPDVTNGAWSSALKENGYNFYGDWSTANDDFLFLANGVVTGPFEWLDSYINQIWMNNQFQLALLSLLYNTKSVPYNPQGYAMIRAACLDVINQAVNFGAIRANVTLSNAQAAEVVNAAGQGADVVLSQRGWFLRIADPTPQVRAQRGTPQCSFFYMDGQSVQRIVLSSVEVM